MHFIVIIPTLNAAEHLHWCLRSVTVPGATVMVFDQGSTDGTQEIARNYGVPVHSLPMTFERDGEMETRAEMTKRALRLCTMTTNIVTLDADEILSDGWPGHILKARLVNNRAFTIPYYQLIGDARYMQVGNPIEQRLTIFPMGQGPLWVPQPGRNYHCGPTCARDPVHLTTVKRIHLGWIGDLRRRLTMCCDRKDWSTRDDVNADAKARIAENPFAFLQPVVPVAQDLLQSSAVLRDIVALHTALRTVTTEPHGAALKITNISYGP